MLNEAKAIGKLIMNIRSTWANSCLVSQGLRGPGFLVLTSAVTASVSGEAGVSSRLEPEGERGMGGDWSGSGSSTLVRAGVSLP